VLTFLALVLAVFTKEAALYAPIAAALTIAFATRRRLLAAAMLSPLVAWLAVRAFLFVGSIRGLYAVNLNSPRAVILGGVKGLLQWPTGLVGEQAVKKILRQHDLLHNLPSLFFLLVNPLLWILLIAFGVYLLRSRTHKLAVLSPSSILVWLGGALAFGVLVGPDPRFGGSIYPLLLLLLAAATVVLPTPRWRTIPVAVLCMLVPAFLWHARHVPLQREATRRDGMQRLIGALKQHGQRAEVVYVLNSPPSFSAPHSLARLAAIPGRVVVLNEFDGCVSATAGETALSRSDSSELHVVAQLPSCATIIFDSVNPATLKPAIGGHLQRNDLADYKLPAARIVGHSVRDSQLLELDLGDRLDITLRSVAPDRSILLYYDWTTARYRCAGQGCAGA
jgi:hypothetical protein